MRIAQKWWLSLFLFVSVYFFIPLFALSLFINRQRVKISASPSDIYNYIYIYNIRAQGEIFYFIIYFLLLSFLRTSKDMHKSPFARTRFEDVHANSFSSVYMYIYNFFSIFSLHHSPTILLSQILLIYIYISSHPPSYLFNGMQFAGVVCK